MTLLVVLGTRLGFFNDDWYFLLHRRGLTAKVFLAPHNGHLSALSVLTYKVLVGLFGLGSQLPFRLVLAAAVAATGVFLYLLVAPRLGRLPALAAAAVALLLGPAWEDLMWAFQIGVVGSLAAGLASLLALERDTPRRNALACGALVVSISLSDVGLPFVVGAAIVALVRGKPRQLWIAAVPGLIFGAWYVGYGHTAHTYLSFDNVRHLPRYLIVSAGSGLASVSGLHYSGEVRPPGPLAYGLLALCSLGIALLWRRTGAPSSRVLVFAGTLLTFWSLAGLNYIPGRDPPSSRYQLVNAALLILIGAELLKPVRLARWQTVAIAVLGFAVAAVNVQGIFYGYRFMRGHSAFARVDLGALELAGDRAPAGLRLTGSFAGDAYLGGVSVAAYRRETAEHGSPAFATPAQIAAAPEDQRRAADGVLVNAEGLRLRLGPSSKSPRCTALTRSATSKGVLIPPGGASIRSLGASTNVVVVWRFASASMPTPVGFLPPRSSARLVSRPDAAALPWRFSLLGSAPVELCPLSSAGRS